MEAFITQGRDVVQVVFWGTVAYLADQALRRRQLLRRVTRFAPFTAGAAAAYLIGCFVGAALVTLIP
jgi:hypothetical protein